MDNEIKRKKTIKAVSSLIVLGLASYLYVDNPDFFTTKNKNISCRIGITMDVERRKKEWKKEVFERRESNKKLGCY